MVRAAPDHVLFWVTRHVDASLRQVVTRTHHISACSLCERQVRSLEECRLVTVVLKESM